MMMIGVAVGWQVYDLTHNAMALGLVGLAQFLPAMLLTLPGGLAADRFDRRYVLLFGFSLLLAVAIALYALTLLGSPHVGWIYAVVVFIGVGRSFLAPASQSLLPFLVPQQDFVRAVAWNSTGFEIAMIAGPAAGGFLYALGPAYVYGIASLCLLVATLLVVTLHTRLKVSNPAAANLSAVFAGVRFVFSKPVILGAVSLDLFAVLFGGATALLPMYAGEILHVGPWGLGLLRSAPAVGAAIMAVWIAHHPIRRGAGWKLFAGVGVFGLSTIVFGLSHYFFLSLIALIFLGASDMISVVVRQTLVQINTPNEMRGRVSAVNMLFIGASNELGEFESGITAAWWGVIPAVVIGGLGTLGVVAFWSWRFPELRRMDSLEAKHD
jgi:MFS family permease